MINHTTEQVLRFIENSPTAFHAVENLKNELNAAGFTRLKETEIWKLQPGGKYYVTRNHSSILSFTLPSEKPDSFRLIASHSDSPCFRIKTDPEIIGGGACVKLNVERYGGAVNYSWFDRPLSAAGRIIVESEGKLEEKLVNIDRDLLMIPSLAIHMEPQTNKGIEFNIQNDMLPVLTQIKAEPDTEEARSRNHNDQPMNNKSSRLKPDPDEILKSGQPESLRSGTFPKDSGKTASILDLIAWEAGVDKEDILDADLFVYNRMKPVFWGAENEYIASGRLDDLECCYSTFLGFLESARKGPDLQSVSIHVVFDNEEVGSGTAQGADSTFLAEIMERISLACGCSREEFMAQTASSFMLSADNAHAVHPNHPEKADPVNRPCMNRGIVIKHNANQKYTTDGVSGAMLIRLCRENGIPYQHFTNRSDMAGGSTLGNISQAHVSMRTADIGLAQLAMHSSYESAGADDPEYMKQLAEAFYRKGCGELK